MRRGLLIGKMALGSVVSCVIILMVAYCSATTGANVAHPSIAIQLLIGYFITKGPFQLPPWWALDALGLLLSFVVLNAGLWIGKRLSLVRIDIWASASSLILFSSYLVYVTQTSVLPTIGSTDLETRMKLLVFMIESPILLALSLWLQRPSTTPNGCRAGGTAEIAEKVMRE
jgi:hypothetical protein